MILGMAWVLLAMVVGCQRPIPSPDLGDRYDRSAMHHGPDRNPVIVIPGILGSKLHHPPTDTRVWGAFEGGAADPGTPEGARLIALPMRVDARLAELTDRVEPDGALETVRLSLLGLPFELEAYAQILGTLGVGGYRDDQLARSGAVDYGSDHYTCFQFDYDWRRDNVENARRLHRFILERRRVVQQNLAEDFGGVAEDYDVKFDIVAHSMGGLLTRYMLRFGDTDLPEDGTTPPVTWQGARHVDRAVLVGTPSAGALNALVQLVEGAKYSPLHNGYRPAILGTMPAIYQLLPRDRHRRVLFDAAGDPSLYSPQTWVDHGWGLAARDQRRQLQKLLPEVADPEARQRIALDHLTKCLRRAEQLHRALDQPARLPQGLSMILYAGDGQPTPDRARARGDGRLVEVAHSSGDGTVTRDSALMDERLARPDTAGPRLVSPVDWTDVNLLFTDHLGLTADPVFADNVLHLLLESPRRGGADD